MDEPLYKRNCRPFNVLPCLSKLFERIEIYHINVFSKALNTLHLSGFRKGPSQSTVLGHVEGYELAVDSNHVYGTCIFFNRYV